MRRPVSRVAVMVAMLAASRACVQTYDIMMEPAPRDPLFAIDAAEAACEIEA